MAKIFFNTRDELVALNTEEIAMVQADGNYSRVHLVSKREVMLSVGLTKVEDALEAVKGRGHRFVRLGRSCIVNHTYLHKIDLAKQVITLTDGSDVCTVKVAKSALRSYKDAIVKSIKLKKK